MINLFQLREHEFLRILPILDHHRTPTFAYSIVHRIVPGVVYVDYPKDPKSAFLGTNSGIYYIVGEETNRKFNESFKAFFMQHVKSKHVRFTFFSSSDHWDKVIQRLLKGEFTQMTRKPFVFHPSKFRAENMRIPENFRLQKIDEEIIQRSVDFNESYYEEYWGSVSNFLSNGFGFCLLDGDGKIVSECTSIFLANGYAEIDIVTHPEYRGRGFAALTSKAFIEYCLSKGLIPRWDCDENNVSSMKLAEKLGFSYPQTYCLFIRKRNK